MADLKETLITQQPGHTLDTQRQDATPRQSPGPAGAAPSQRSAPATIGRYVLQEEIARGGMGVIHRAIDPSFGRDVAIKLIHERYAGQGAAKRRFLEEAQITGQLQHPGIPPVHELGEVPDGRPFLVMKLIKGQTLHDLLASRNRERPVRSHFIAIFEQICQALGYAHSHGVIHRDLKPANIMVGAFGEVQVMDWGLAKLVNRDARRSADSAQTDSAAPPATAFQDPRADSDGSATRPGAVLGTPAYMPPEQAAGVGEEVDVQSDVFGLGAILCQILTGKPPYVGASADAVGFKAIRGDLTDAGDRLDKCGAEPEVVALCKRCLAADKPSRPGNAGEVAQAVAALRAQAVERARQAELERAKVEVFAAEQRKRRWVVQIAAGLIMTALVAGLGLSLGQMNRALQAERQARENEKQAKEKDAITTATLDFVENRIFAAARPKDQDGGLGYDVKLADAIKAALPFVEKNFTEQPLIEARLRMTIGLSLIYLGDPKAAAQQCEAAHALYTKHKGPDSNDTLGSAFLLANACDGLGHHARALALREETLARAKVVLGHDDPNTLKLMHNLSKSYRILNRNDEALKLLQAALPLMQARLGPDHSDTLAVLAGLASCHANLGRYSEALPLHETVLAALKTKHGLEHAEVLTAMHTLANAYAAAGRHEDAVPLFEQTLALRLARLGPDHHDTFLTAWRLALSLIELGRGAKAISIIDDCVRRSRGQAIHPGIVPGLLEARLRHFQKALDAGECRITAEMCEDYKLPDTNRIIPAADWWCFAACMRAVTASVIRATDPSDAGRRDAALEADKAMALLRRAVAGGYHDVDGLKTDADLSALRDRDDFKKLVAELEKASKASPPEQAPR